MIYEQRVFGRDLLEDDAAEAVSDEDNGSILVLRFSASIEDICEKFPSGVLDCAQ